MSAYRSYVPWSKSNLSSSYSGSGSSYLGSPKASETTAKTTPTATENKYDSGYMGRRYGSTTGSTSTTGSSYRPSYLSPSATKYGSSSSLSSPSNYVSSKDKEKDKSTATTTTSSSSNSSSKETPPAKEPERQSIREKYNMGPALPSSTTKSVTASTKANDDKLSIRDKYSSKDDRQSLIDKYSSGTYPGRSTDSPRSYSSSIDRKEDHPSPYGSRTSLRSSSSKTEPETDKTTSGYNTLSPYRLYERTSSPYSRSTSKDTGSISSTTSTPCTTPVNTPSSLRYGTSSTTSSRYGGSLPRSPVNDKPVLTLSSPTPESYRSTRRSRQEAEDAKVAEAAAEAAKQKEVVVAEPKVEVETKSVDVVTRGTSPTPPSTSSFLRTRRAELSRAIEKTIQRPVARPETADKEVQTDKGEETPRVSKYGLTTRSTVSPWTSYLDRFSNTSITPTVNKYSTRSYSGYTSPRDATVSTSSPNTSTSEAAKASPSLVKEESKDVGKVEKVPASEETKTEKAAVVKKSPSMKKVDGLKKTASSTKLDGVGLKKAPSVTKLNETGLKKAPSVTKLNETGLKKAPSVTKLNETGLKKAPSVTKLNETGLKKAPSVTKLNEDSLKKTTISTKVEDASKSPAVSKSDSSNEKLTTLKTDEKPPVTTKLEETEIAKKAVTKPKIDLSLKRTPSITKLDDSSSSALKSPTLKKAPVALKKSESLEKSADAIKKSPSAAKVVESPTEDKTSKPKEETEVKKDDVDVLKGALAGLIRANASTPRKRSLTKTDSLSESETDSSKVKPGVVRRTRVKTDSASESHRTKSSSPDKSKTPPQTPLPATSSMKLGSPSLNRKLLPPPVPKVDSPTTALKTSTSQHSLNKDFRKSTLNMDVANQAEAEELQKQQEKQRKIVKKTTSGSDVSETSEVSEAVDTKGSSLASPPSSQSAAPALKTSKSLSNSKIVSTSILKTTSLKVPSPKRQSPARKSPSSSESSSGETESSESSSSSSSDDEEESQSRSSLSNLPQSSMSPSLQDKNRSLLSPNTSKNIQGSSADESSLAEKPPRPPSSPKPAQKEEAKSFLMRALTPVTNFFKAKPVEPGIDSSSENISVLKTDSTTSMSKSLSLDKDDNKPPEVDNHKKKHKIRHIESGERAWWLNSSDSIPEGVQRIKSSKSISRMSSETDGDKINGVKKHRMRHIESGDRSGWLDNNDIIPEDAVSNSKSKTSSSDQDNKKDQLRLPRICKQESGERAWWLDSNANIPEGIERIQSSTSVNKLSVESDKDSKSQAEDETKKKKILIRKQESGERAWWLDSNSNIPEGVERIKSSSSLSRSKESPKETRKKFAIRHQESGEKAWWMNSSSTDLSGALGRTVSKSSLAKLKKDNTISSGSSESDESDDESEDEQKKGNVQRFPMQIPVAVVTPPDEETGRTSPYDNVPTIKTNKRTVKKRPKNLPLFISNHRNIDDILGTAATLVDPMQRANKTALSDHESDDEIEDCEEVDAEAVRIHDSTAQKPTIRRLRNVADDTKRGQSTDSEKLDDTALQLYKDGDYGSYLDLEASISEQQEEFDGFQTNRKNSIVLRTQLSVRVHTIIEKLLNSEGRELRRALFSLKQIFQEDKDLVHEFVQNDGLACLIKVGSEADQNYQNYILRALGQVMLYVDGMNGVMDHNRTVQWLYTLISSKFRLVVKTALKLLLVFVEYVDTNCMLLIKAVNAVDMSQGLNPWSNIMKLVKDYDSADTELLIYATTLVNKTLNGVPDQDTYYDQVDALEEQGVEGAIQRYMSKQGTDLDLLRQFQIYEAVLHHEDGEEKGTPLKQLDETIRKTLRNRKSPAESLTLERRKSRRHSTGTTPQSNHIAPRVIPVTTTLGDNDEETGSSSSRSSPVPGEAPQLNGNYKDKQTDDAGVTPALRRRRERAERQRSFIREQQETSANLRATLGLSQEGADDENELTNGSNKLNRVSSRKDLTPLMNAANKLDSADNECKSPETNGILKSPWNRMYTKNGDETNECEENNIDERGEEATERMLLLQLKRENTVKDLTQKLASQNILNSPVEEKVITRIGDMSGLISKAKEGLAKSKSKADVVKSPSGDVLKLMEMKKSETELHWEELVSGMKRPLEVCDLDFTDLKSDDETDVLSPAHVSNGIPPPPPPAPIPPMGMKDGPPPPPPNRLGSFVPPPCPTTPTTFGVNLRHQRNNATSPEKAAPTPPTPSKTKKTVKLFWKEVRDDNMLPRQHKGMTMIWDELSTVTVDTQKLEHLFESRAKDLITKEKQQEMNKTKEVIVLDHKRSNAINIGMTKLPPPRSIKTAIMKMDATIMTREGIEKLLTMLPTEDEQSKIQEAQMANPDMPLGSAEQFLLTLASISELSARLKLWAFKLDYENSEKEVADPLMDLKQGVETLRVNKTFRGILSTLLSIGIFLNGNEVKGFQIEYLAKVPEVKDTVHKHSLLHHLCHMVMEKFPDATDLYSEIGAVTRASKVDFDELATNIFKMEQECKASWDHLKDIAKHDGSTMMKVKMSDFLADCAERIIVLGIVHRRVMNRYHKFLLWLGIPIFRVPDMKPNEFCRIVSEFALEYRTTRERVLQQLEKKANHRERNKTRGKMITEFGKFRTKEDHADAELRKLLGNHGSDLSDAETPVHGSLPWRRQRKVLGPLIRDETINGGNMTDGDDEILESLVKTATKLPGTRTTPRERKRTRHADLKRSRTRENNVGGEGSASP